MTEQTINRIRQFTAGRDWDQFHTPANLAKSISIEANEAKYPVEKAKGSNKNTQNCDIINSSGL